ncbi:MAG TPA: hypothetical protein VHE37_14530 [Nevskiaceae bacterium]|nr:hypothetical protein [Nevskiaceae bacterium]
MKHPATRARFALIDLWHGLKPLALIAVLTLAIYAAVSWLDPQWPAWNTQALPLWLKAWLALCIVLLLLLPRRAVAVPVPALNWRLLLAAAALPALWLALARAQWLQRYLGPLMIAAAGITVIGSGIYISMDARRRRHQRGPREEEVLAEIGRRAEQSTAGGMAQLRRQYPDVFARIASRFDTHEDRTAVWLMRPHPALANQRPIDVLGMPGGEEKVLQAFEAGPNA